MAFMKISEPRRFNYKPRFSGKGNENKRIRFNRKTKYDPHADRKLPLIYFAIAVMILIWLLISGGIKKNPALQSINAEDAVKFPAETK